MKNTILILISFLLLFSCQPEIQRSQEILTKKELGEKLYKMDAFHRFLEVEEKYEQEVEGKRINLEQKDHWWVLHIHEKYPSLEGFLETAPERSIRKYELLTGIDVLAGNPEIFTLLQRIHSELEDRFIFQIGDLNELLFYSKKPELLEASYAKKNCLNFCNREANDEFERVLGSCTRSDQMYCTHRALIARHYFHRGCMAGCNYQEE
ncbi:MAG: hypothetical protein AAFR87_34775 [Bacteroidota bacterium]